MSLTTTGYKIEYTGNGSLAGPYPFPYWMLNSTSVVVVVAGVVQTSGYTTTGSGSSWNVNFTTAPVNGAAIILRRSTANTQETDYVDGSAFPANNFEDDLDKRTAVSQEVDGDGAYHLRYSEDEASIVAADITLPLRADRISKAMGWDASGNVSPITVSSVSPGNASAVVYDPAGTGAVATTSQAKHRESLSVIDKGADPTGVLSSDTAFANAWAEIKETGGGLLIPPGTYLLNAQWLVDVSTTLPYNYKITGYGAELKAGAAVTGHAIQVYKGYNNFGVSIEGLHFNHRGNTTVGGCINLSGAANPRVIDCSVEHHDTKAGYSGIRVGPYTPGTGSTSSFWSQIDGFKTRQRSGGDGTNAAIGIQLELSANATKIKNCSFGGVVDAILLTSDGVSTVGGNAIRIIENDFEGVTNCIRVDTAALTSVPTGVQVAFNRCESTTNFLAFYGSIVTAATKANPCAITAVGHGMITGNTAYFSGVGGMTQLNGNSYTVTVVDVDNFTLDATDSTAYGTFTTGGYVSEKLTNTNYGVSTLNNYLGTGSVDTFLVNPASQFVWSYEPSQNALGASVLGGPFDFEVVPEGSGNHLVVRNLSGVSNWNGAHLVLGTYHLWVDTSSGKLMIKSSAPTSTADGTVVGAQT